MATYLVRDVSGTNARVVEAEGFIIEESNRIVFHDENSNPVALFLNVTVEPCAAGRTSSKELVDIAQRYINLQAEDLFFDTVEERESVAARIRSLAGSVLSQANKDD